jgi:hypothetical protein
MEKATARPASSIEACTQFTDVAVNQVFYRREPHMMQRYAALALDNIRRDPIGFALASAYRAGRLFLIQGTSDRSTAMARSVRTRTSRRAFRASCGGAMAVVAGCRAAGRRADSSCITSSTARTVAVTTRATSSCVVPRAISRTTRVRS